MSRTLRRAIPVGATLRVLPRLLPRVLARISARLALAALLVPCAFAAKHKPAPAPPPVRSSQPPSCTIPVSQLGFSAPGELYLGSRNALVSLDFLDENRLLFTFRVPGLLRRDPNGEPEETERHIRAVVLRIPDGTVQSEALWTVHDRERYLFMLDSGQFLLRDRDTIQVGDSTLQLAPWLHFPGRLLWLQIDPERDLVLADSREPASRQPKSGDAPGDVPAPATAQASVTSDQNSRDGDSSLAPAVPDLVLRILRRSGPDSGKVLLTSRIRTAVHLPFNSRGYVEPLRSRGPEWLLTLDYFTGGTTRIGAVDSACVPGLDFLSPTEFLATVCNGAGTRSLVALTLDGKRLWQFQGSDNAIWPSLAVSQNGARVARETILANHAVNSITPLSAEDITRQEVVVLDAATGNTVLRAQPSPIFDLGGNVALSPSGRRAAVVMADGIEIFDLPDPPAAPPPA
jgi:hypothetical protein